MNSVEYLFSLERFGIKLGLENIRTLCRALGDPQERFRSIHVAGTNGKGSVSAMIDTALRAAGYRTGRYTSPHLIRVEERFVVDGSDVEAATLASVAADVRAAIQQLRERGDLRVDPTFFEATTACAFELFRRATVDVAILEVGLGGRFDATNVLAPLAGAITTVDFDHQEHLGQTLTEIAHEKAGIIKPGMIVVTGETKPEALGEIEAACAATGARCVKASDASQVAVTLRGVDTFVDITTPVRTYAGVHLGLRGRHQAQNALTVVRVLEELSTVGVPVNASAITQGLSAVRWRARLEVVERPGGRRLILDAAHNPAGAAALAAFLREAFPDRVPIVFGAMADKDTRRMLAALAPCATAITLTTATRRPRAADPAALAAELREVAPQLPCRVEPDPAAAVETASLSAPVTCVTGSIYMLGDLLAALEA
jgi:dihydrofolate synthase/folylpolyglutamate synthase